MLNHPVIELVTSATDWPAIWTGIVGVAGITAAYFQNKAARRAASADLKESLDATAGNLETRISAEDRRALQAQKQRVYSELQGSMDDVFVAAIQLHDRATGEADLSNALKAMYKATAAAKLIAPEPIGELANGTARAMADETGTARAGTAAFDRDNKIYDNRQKLYTLMRQDLGVDEPRGHAGSPAVESRQARPSQQANDVATVTPPPDPQGTT